MITSFYGMNTNKCGAFVYTNHWRTLILPLFFILTSTEEYFHKCGAFKASLLRCFRATSLTLWRGSSVTCVISKSTWGWISTSDWLASLVIVCNVSATNFCDGKLDSSSIQTCLAYKHRIPFIVHTILSLNIFIQKKKNKYN